MNLFHARSASASASANGDLTRSITPPNGGFPSATPLHHNHQQHPSTHSFTVADTVFTLDKRYSYLATKGVGAYGVVIAVHDERTGKNYAVKKIPEAFDDLTDAKRIVRECMLMRHLLHDNVVHMWDIQHPHTSIDDFKDVYMVMDVCDTDLHRIIYSRQPLLDEHVQFFVFQIMRGLKYIHSAGVLHRDLKPSNLLVDASCDLKICDFGLARGVQEEDNANLTEYVVTRWYRAPEIMLACKNYSCAVDVWSTGCIMAEMLGRKPLFPGEDYIQQLQLINEVLGSPTDEQLGFIPSDKARRFMKGLPRRSPQSLGLRFPGCNPIALDLLEKMLRINPDERITVDAALAHPYLTSFSTPSPDAMEEDGVVNPTCADVFKFGYEKFKLTGTMLRELMWLEMSHYHPEARVEFEERRARGQLHIDLLGVPIPPAQTPVPMG